jgi:beta-galactosidase
MLMLASSWAVAQNDKPALKPASPRERLLMDSGWKFALGHPFDAEKDFNHGTGYFSYFAKAGYGDGPAAGDFDDRAWRVLSLPHDWAVELPFDGRGGHSHGYRAIGRAFPENSVGWYRKTFFIPESDLGRRITVEFDGVHRNSDFWLNGFYLGKEHFGSSSFQFDVTDYLNYGGNNAIAVRVDAVMEEGWYYEGAGIYRHVWLTKTPALHVGRYGTFVSTTVENNAALVSAATTVVNETGQAADFDVVLTIQDALGTRVASGEVKDLVLGAGEKGEYQCVIRIENPRPWSPESPHLYQLNTVIRSNRLTVDADKIPFGVRTVRFDPNEGFFLNGKHVKLKGTNNHQDHAGVGTALPDALQEFRIKTLKSMGCNAYRTSHHPPTPELLDACDRLGMLVLDENRLMGSSPEQILQLERMILRDRNHPCVIAWSLGNEEWAIEGNVKGERITATMQAAALRLDPTRRIAVASSGGWGQGVSKVIDAMGFNYITHGNIDEHHKNFPNQPGMGTEETTGSGTRGVYEDDRENGRMAATDRSSRGPSIETGMKYYDARPFLAGLFYWTGFDYRGEPNPLAWPAVSSQFGILDLCGFPKDNFYYLKSWWTDVPVLHLSPHWNWKGKEGRTMAVRAYGNCEEAELFLNGKSLGRKPIPRLGHAEWEAAYEPGTLSAAGYTKNRKVITEKIETTGDPAAIRSTADRALIKADGEDVSVITVQVVDDKGRFVPTAGNEIMFSLKGQGRMIGAGNGDPASHEPEQFLSATKSIKIEGLKMAFTSRMQDHLETSPIFDDSRWALFRQTDEINRPKKDTLIIVRGTFELPPLSDGIRVTLFTKSICEDQSVYVNGKSIATGIRRNAPNQDFVLDHRFLNAGKNSFTVVGVPFVMTRQWENLNADPGLVQLIVPAGEWKRKAFNGLAQVILQSERQAGEITLTASSPGLKSATIRVRTVQADVRPSVPEK